MSCAVGRRHGLDPTLLWLWCRLTTAAPFGPLAWESPCAAGAAIGKTKKKSLKGPEEPSKIDNTLQTKAAKQVIHHISLSHPINLLTAPFISLFLKV